MRELQIILKNSFDELAHEKKPPVKKADYFMASSLLPFIKKKSMFVPKKGGDYKGVIIIWRWSLGM
jgi:hypothetical protein